VIIKKHAGSKELVILLMMRPGNGMKQKHYRIFTTWHIFLFYLNSFSQIFGRANILMSCLFTK